MRFSLRVVKVALFLCLWVSAGLAAAQWVVSPDGDGSHRTIQGAMEAARFGDTIFVHSGIYTEQVSLKDGVSLVGAGVGSTIVQYVYGFEPVVLVKHASSGRVEGLTIERLRSILPGPTVLVESGSVAFVDCTISGGQGAGIEVRGSTSAPMFERVLVAGNHGHGLWAHGSARVRADGFHLVNNEGAGILLSGGASLELYGGVIERNAQGGLVLEDDATVELRSCRVFDHEAWGISVVGLASVTGAGIDLLRNALGGVRLDDDATVELAGLAIDGGGPGILAEGRSAVFVEGGSIRNVRGDGVAIVGSASGTLLDCEISGAEGHGITADTDGELRVGHSTVVLSGQDGLRMGASRASVDHCIAAYNRAAGLHVPATSGPSPTLVLGYNNVWGNGSDYVGLAPRATDVAEAPEFANLLGGNLALRPGSPCLGAGSGWTDLGAGSAAVEAYPTTLDLRPSFCGGFFGETWYADLRLAGSPLELLDLGVGMRFDTSWLSLNVESSWLGSWSRRTRVDGIGSLPASFSRDTGQEIELQYGFAAVVAGVESWASLWGQGILTADAFHASFRLGMNWPSSVWSSRIEVGISAPWSLLASLETADLTLRSLNLSAKRGGVVAGGDAHVWGRLALVPRNEIDVGADWVGTDQTWSGLLGLDPASGAWRAEVGFEEAAVELDAALRFDRLTFVEGSLTLGFWTPPVRLTAGFGLRRGWGPGVSAKIEVDLAGWFTPQQNEPPVPKLAITPMDPESGTPVRLSAAESYDPDGEVREHWWDFGDGGLDYGISVTHAYAAAGSYEVTLTVTDDRGAVTTLVETIDVWEANTRPTAVFIASAVSVEGTRLPHPVRAGDTIELDASGSVDRDGVIVEYAWDLQSDGVFESKSEGGIMIVPPLPAGSYPMTLRVTDETGRTDAVMHVVFVDVAEAPHADFSLNPPTPAVGDPVYFTDHSLDTDGKVATWRWDFGDGGTSRQASPTHRFDEVGTFVVTLRVLDDDGLAGEVSRQVEVAAVPSVVSVENVWGLAIGISDYEAVKDLQFGREDAVAFARWLLDAGLPSPQIRLLLDREGAVEGLDGLLSKRASLVNVREALGWLRRVAQPDDLVLIHFSGHGFQGQDDNGDERDGVDEFFVLYDSVPGALEDTALRDDEFGRFLDRLPSQHVIVFFDGCYSGGLSRSLPSSARPVGDPSDLFSDFSLEGKLVFSASGEAQDAFESTELRHGIFSYYVLEGLRGAGDLNADHRVTAWELYEYLAGAVPARAMLEHGVTQEPRLTGQGEVRVLLSSLPRLPVPAFSYVPDVPFAGGEIRFTDETQADLEPHECRWLFGDGAGSTAPDPEHVYSDAGEYTVRLTVTDADGNDAATEAVLSVSSSGRALSVDPATGRLVVSLGRRNGVAIGDRFNAWSGAGNEAETRLVVVELLGEEAAACRVIEGPLPEVGAAILPSSEPAKRDGE